MENIPRIHNIWPSRTEEFLKERQCDPEQFKGRIIFMSMFAEKCKSNSHEVANCARKFFTVIGRSWDLDQNRNGAELILISLMEFGTKMLRK